MTLLRISRAIPKPVRALIARIAMALIDPKQANYVIVALLVLYATFWALSATIRNLGGTLHGDMLEEYSDSKVLLLGYSKHPPLIDWITGAWFAVMPATPWAFYLLSCLNAALGLWAVWLACGRVVDTRRRVLAVALLGLLPIFTFHAATFNHNTLQLSLWPLVALTFLISMERENLGWAILFGATSALALYGKYYAVWIVLACALAALIHPNRRTYFRLARPYIAATTYIVGLVPHFIWLMHAEFMPISRLSSAVFQPLVLAFVGSLRHLAAYVAYLLPALVAIQVFLRPSFQSLCQDWPPMRRVVACIALAPIILPAVLFPLFGLAPNAPWLYPAFFLGHWSSYLLPIFSSPAAQLRELLARLRHLR